jgi:hypothetical protein
LVNFELEWKHKEKTFKLPNGLDIACKEIGNQNSTIKNLCLHGWLENVERRIKRQIILM